MNIDKTNRLFATLNWVASARSDDETRYFMRGLNIESEGDFTFAVATDGRRCHFAKIPTELWTDYVNVGPGNYTYTEASAKLSIIGDPIEEQFPNWRKVIPSMDPKRQTKDYGSITFPRLSLKNDALDLGPTSRELILHFRLTGRILNLAYFVALSDATWTVIGEDNPDQALEYAEVPYGPGPLVGIIRHAVVMPMMAD